MIRRLLSDRFGLVMRVEDKSMAVYALTVSSDGPKATQVRHRAARLRLQYRPGTLP